MVADHKIYWRNSTGDAAVSNLRLPAATRDLQIDYTALSLVAPEKVHFKYMLEGQDQDWREVINDRQAQYTNLPPRHYRFRVIASNNSGVWNEQGDVLDFSIAPAYYQTNWFRALCVAAVSGIAVGGVPIAAAAIASAVRDAAGGARRRAHTYRAGSARHAAAKLPRFAAAVPDCFPVAAGALRRRRKRSWTTPSSRLLTRSPKVGMRCRDCALPQSKATISR